MFKPSCCFTGHRNLPSEEIVNIAFRLDNEIDALIDKGVRHFISGGALGFDQIAASIIVAKKENGNNIRLSFELPCCNQDKKWTREQKRHYRLLLEFADNIHYVSEDYFAGCMKMRNISMVEQSDFCICALLYENTGTSQTVAFARRKGLQIINVAK